MTDEAISPLRSARGLAETNETKPHCTLCRPARMDDKGFRYFLNRLSGICSELRCSLAH